MVRTSSINYMSTPLLDLILVPISPNVIVIETMREVMYVKVS